MYNEEQKMRFLKETRRSPVYGASIFRATESVEEKYGVDLCLLPAEAIQSILNEKLGIRAKSVGTACVFLKAYFSWCRDNGIETGNGLEGLSVKTEEKIRNTMVASPKHLELILDKAFDPVESETIDCIYRCFLWMAFSGMEETDAVNVKIPEVDFIRMVIRHQDREYEMYKEALPAFHKACELTKFIYQHFNPEYKVSRARYPGDNLFRGFRSEKIKVNSLRSVVSSRFHEKKMKLSYDRLVLSGTFYRAYEMERAGFTPDFSDVVEERVERVDRAYSGSYCQKKTAASIKNELLNDYASWKHAFA